MNVPQYGGFLTYSVGTIRLNLSTSTDVGKAIVALGIPGGVALFVVFGVLAALAYLKRGGVLHAIKNESRQVPQPDGTSA